MHIIFQSGQFDNPDRLFYSIHEFWHSSTHGLNNFHELIPQFFSSAHFLINSNHYKFGVRSDKLPVNEVILTKWVKTPYEFIQLNFLALWSNFVSEKLNIGLI
jgi:hypothetical protein